MGEYKKTFSVSIRGASHIKNGKPLQDYSLAIKGDNFSIAVVCDGHGADKHFRSEIGSSLAAQVAKENLCNFATIYPDWTSVSKKLPEKLDRLKLSIISGWQDRIEEHERENKFTEDEMKKVSSSFSKRSKFDIASPYGTTLLAALVCKDYYLVLMLGDGAIAKIMPDYSAEIVTFPGKVVYDDQPHSATDSLCEPDCYSKLHILCHKIDPKIGIAFALCSDGLSESFMTDDILLSKLKNYLNYYAEEGLENATKAIEAQLNELSRVSPMKDDISLAFATNDLALYDKRDENSVEDDQKENLKQDDAFTSTAENMAKTSKATE